MTSGEKHTVISTNPSFSEVLDEACQQLLDRQIKYSIRRIQDMEGRLALLEQELNLFLQKNGIR